jgi:hypothetical protein
MEEEDIRQALRYAACLADEREGVSTERCVGGLVCVSSLMETCRTM